MAWSTSQLSSRLKQLLFSIVVLTLLVFFLTPFWKIVNEMVINPYFSEKENQTDNFEGGETALNELIESEPESYPLHIQSGFVEFSEAGNYSTYRFGPKGNPTKFLDANGFSAKGIYAKSGSFWKKVSNLSELQNGDYVVITYYEAPARSDNGVKGKTILGIVDLAAKDRSNLSVSFLDDPQKETYAFPDSFDYRTEDHYGVYKFKDTLADNVKRGSPLRISFDDKKRIKAVTVLSPRVDIIDGKVTSVSLNESGETIIRMENHQQRFILNNETYVVKRGEPDSTLDISAVTSGKFVHIVYYNRQNDYVVLSLDYQ